MKLKQLCSYLLLCSILLSAASCGGSGSTDNPNNDTTPADVSDTEPVSKEYDFQGKDFGGYEFKILNLDSQYDSYLRLDFEEESGESLDDAVYRRNRLIEEKLNFHLKEIIQPNGEVWDTGHKAHIDRLINSVMADDDEFDAAYLPTYFKPDVVTGGYLMNLLDIPELHVYDEYWDAEFNKEMTISQSLFTASSPLNFMSVDLLWVLMFNETMMDSYNLEYPYQVVRDGKWTLDKMLEYCSSVANLNGDESFTFNAEGNAVYGISAHHTTPMSLIYSAGAHNYEHDKDGNIVLTLESDRLYTALEKIGKICTTTNGNTYFNASTPPDPGSYLMVFSSDRALFLGCQIESVNTLREMESAYGLLPMPKLDEAQENYSAVSSQRYMFLTIPVTQDDTARAGLILDALSYESWKSALPVYYENRVSQKGLRNDDSIEMLEIVRNNSSMDMLNVYKIQDEIYKETQNLIRAGTGDVSGVASAIAKNKAAVEQRLQDFVLKIKDLEAEKE